MKEKSQVIEVPVYLSSGRNTRNSTSANPITASCLPLLMQYWLKFPIGDNITNKVTGDCLVIFQSTMLVLCYFILYLIHALTIQIESRNKNTSGVICTCILLDLNSIH
jgi:hypothetical protein